MPTKFKPDQQHPRPRSFEDEAQLRHEQGLPIAYIERRQRIGAIAISEDASETVEAAVLRVIADYLDDHVNLDGNLSRDTGAIHDELGFTYQGHRVRVQLGDAVEDR